MLRSATSVAAISTLVCMCAAAYYKDVTADDFDKLIDASKASIMLEFYAPWCGHCKNLAPEYEQLGETFARTPEVIIAQVDADKHKSLATRFGIKGFPTLKWIPKGGDVDKPEDVDAGRTAEDLLKYVNQKTGTSKKLKSAGESKVTTITTSNFNEIVLDKSKHALVGFFAPWCGHCKALKPIWEELAALYADEEDVIVSAIDCDAHGELAQEYGVEGFPTIKFFGTEEADVQDYKGGRTLDDFVGFLNEKASLDLATDGGVVEGGGVVTEIEEHVKSYLSAATDEEREKAVATCEDQVDKLDGKAQSNFKYYAKVFGKIAEKGKEYVNKEKERLSKMLSKAESLKSSQRRSFMRRLNVLTVFDEL